MPHGSCVRACAVFLEYLGHGDYGTVGNQMSNTLCFSFILGFMAPALIANSTTASPVSWSCECKSGNEGALDWLKVT